MRTYLVLRRSGWRSPEALDEATARATGVADEVFADDVRLIRSYVIEEASGLLGMVCIYQATGPAAINEHASRAILPADEIVAVAGTVLVRPDPAPMEV